MDKADEENDSNTIEVYGKKEKTDINHFFVKQHTAVSADPSSKMVIGTSWTHKHIRRIAKAFGDVIFVHTTEETNDEERPVLTLSMRNSFMKQVIVLRKVLPNNQRW
eukprot:9188407-Ditylum_brightwellii.AAC.1